MCACLHNGSLDCRIQSSSYPSDLTDAQWGLILPFIPKAKRGGRRRTTCIREVMNSIFYVLRTGCAWRYLPMEFPPWQTVYSYFSQWQQMGVWKTIHGAIRRQTRLNKGKDEVPSCLIIDSQTVKASSGEMRSYDGYKKITGRKRQILVDTLGLIHGIYVHAASFTDCKEGHKLLLRYPRQFRSKLKTIYADQGYRGTFESEVKKIIGIKPSVPPRNTKKLTYWDKRRRNQKMKLNVKSLKMAPKRWIVERTFAWFNFFRRLSRDYEKTVIKSETMIQLAGTFLMIQRLA
jgi:putative transposase